MLSPSDVEFINWAENDSNLSNIQNALTTYPNLINVKDNKVSLTVLVVLFNTTWFMGK